MFKPRNPDDKEVQMPKVRAIAIRYEGKDSGMKAAGGSQAIAILTEHGAKIKTYGYTQHVVGSSGDLTIVFECSDETFDRAREEVVRSVLPATAVEDVPLNQVMMHLSADVLDPTAVELRQLRQEFRARLTERLLLRATPTQRNKVTGALAGLDADVTGRKGPEKADRDDVVDYKIYVQNVSHDVRTEIGAFLSRQGIDGAWGNKVTVKFDGNAGNVGALEEHLTTTIGQPRLLRLDLSPSGTILRDPNAQPRTVRIPTA